MKTNGKLKNQHTNVGKKKIAWRHTKDVILFASQMFRNKIQTNINFNTQSLKN